MGTSMGSSIGPNGLGKRIFGSVVLLGRGFLSLEHILLLIW